MIADILLPHIWEVLAVITGQHLSFIKILYTYSEKRNRWISQSKNAIQKVYENSALPDSS